MRGFCEEFVDKLRTVGLVLGDPFVAWVIWGIALANEQVHALWPRTVVRLRPAL